MAGILKLMDKKYSRMSKSHKRLTDYIKQNIDECSFMTAQQLGRAAGVSESTVVRYAVELEFSGYAEFQASLRDITRGKLDVVQQISSSYDKSSKSQVITSILKSDIQRIADTMELIDGDAFEEALNIIASARNIYVIGIRQEAPLAGFLAFYLNMMFGNARQIQTSSISEVFEQMIKVDERDAVIGISFPRYSLRTIKAVEFANNRNAKVIVLTDSQYSPLAMYASCKLYAKTESVSIVDSMTAPLSLVNAMVGALCVKCQKEVSRNLKYLEEVWGDYQVYGRDEINFFDEENLDKIDE